MGLSPNQTTLLQHYLVVRIFNPAVISDESILWSLASIFERLNLKSGPSYSIDSIARHRILPLIILDFSENHLYSTIMVMGVVGSGKVHQSKLGLDT